MISKRTWKQNKQVDPYKKSSQSTLNFIYNSSFIKEHTLDFLNVLFGLVEYFPALFASFLNRRNKIMQLVRSNVETIRFNREEEERRLCCSFRLPYVCLSRAVFNLTLRLAFLHVMEPLQRQSLRKTCKQTHIHTHIYTHIHSYTYASIFFAAWRIKLT